MTAKHKTRELSLRAVSALLRGELVGSATAAATQKLSTQPRDIRLLAIDVGSSNCGLALSGPGNTIAFPLQAYVRGSLTKDVAKLAALLRQHCPPPHVSIGALVVGLPLTLGAAEDKTTKAVRRYAAGLAAGGS